MGLSAVVPGCTPVHHQSPPLAEPAGPVVAAEPLTVGPAAGREAVDADDGLGLRIGSGAVDTTGGSIPDGQMVSPFDVRNPVVSLLDPPVRTAIQDAARAAATEGVDVMLTSGWRSKGFQRRLFDQAVTTYGSVAVASEFVASPEASMHVAGKAVDVGPVAADDWMMKNGPRFGLCQIYANEIWHYELAVDASGACPPLRPNAAG
ncbi:MAG: M15 family metallopeptidase [Actinomycetota bacterium]|nr:M15 family metallopeptidase [Actinomycetota bacterium]